MYLIKMALNTYFVQYMFRFYLWYVVYLRHANFNSCILLMILIYDVYERMKRKIMLFINNRKTRREKMINNVINYVNRVLSIFSDEEGLRKRERGEGL